MKKIKRFFRKHTWMFIMIACLIFIPQSFSYQAKLNMRVIVTGMAVDKDESGYEITAQVVMPAPGSEAGGGTATLGFISEKGKSISEGIQKIAYKIGKTAGLSHISYVLVGQSMLDENLAESLDYFVRDPEINTSVMLLVSPTTGKEMITKTQNLELSVAVGLQKVFIYKQASLNGVMTFVNEFINSAFNISKSATISGILITSEGEEKLGETTDQTLQNQNTSGGGSSGQSGNQSGGNSSGGSGNQSSGSSSGGASSQSSQSGGGENGSSSSSSQSQSSGQGSSQKQSGRIKYYNDVYYFKDGKYINKLDKEEELIGFFLANKTSTNGVFNVENVNGGVLKNATVGFQFREQKTKSEGKFKDKKPVVDLNILLKDIQLLEILNEGQPSQKIYHNQDDQTISAIKEAIGKRVEKCVMKAFEKAKADGVDIFKFSDILYQSKPKEWNEFYTELGEAYLDEITLNVNVEIKNIN